MDKDKNKQNSPEDNSREQIVNQSQSELAVQENKVKIVSPGRMVLKRFFRSKLSVIGLVTLVIIFAFAIFGPFLSQAVWGYGELTPDERMAPAVVMDYELSNIETVGSEAGILEIAAKCLGEEYVAIKTDAEGNVTDSATEVSTKVNQNKQRLYDKFKGKQGSFVRGDETLWFEIKQEYGVLSIYLLDRTEAEVNGKMVVSFSQRITTIVKRTSSAKTRNINAAPSIDHWLGTDGSSYDIFTRLMYGGRISLMLSFIVVIIQVVLGILFGGLAGYFGKWIDLIVMRIIDILNCLPGIPLMLIFSSILDGMDVDQSLQIFFLMGMLSLIGWTGVARTVRGQILMLREQEFMVAAEALGLSVPRRIVKHLVPNIMPLLIVSMTLGLGGVILSEATLSFLGMGIKPPQAAWGTMINSANDPIVLQYYPNQWIPAGVMIVLVVLAFNFVGDGLRDAFDPKARR